MDDVRSINPVVGETNDGGLNDIRARPIAAEDVWRALGKAHAGPVEEGSVGAGTGTQALGWKGGIGTSSLVLPAALGGWPVGVLVPPHYGGALQEQGPPVGRELGRHAFTAGVSSARPRHGTDAVVGRSATSPIDRGVGRRLYKTTTP